jgi:hypothetical protein
VRYFARDPTTRTTYYVLGDNQIKRTRDDGSSVAVLEASDSSDSSSSDSDSDSSSLSSSSSSSLFSPSSGELLAGLTSKISSLSYMPTTGTLAATTWGSDRPPVVYLADPDRDGPGVHQLFTFKQYSSIQDSAFRPTGSSDEPGILAVVAKGSLMLFTRSPAGEWHFTTAFETDIDILTVEWLSHTVIVLGQRDGKIRLHDTRSTGSSHVLTHPAPVGKIRLADDPTRIVVAGIEDTLYLYDIRSPRWTGGMADVVNQHYNHQWFAERNTSHRPNSTKRRKLMMGSRKWYVSPKTRYCHGIWRRHCWRYFANMSIYRSQPVISFQHHNTNELDLGLDVHPRLGILAAAQDPTNSEADIIMHNLWTGKVIKELRFRPERRSSSFGRFDTRAGCLRFESDQETGQVCDIGAQAWSDHFHSAANIARTLYGQTAGGMAI